MDEAIPTAEPVQEPATFGEFLKSRAVLFGLVNEQGGADATRLADRLVARKIRATRRAVESWFNGERAPRIGRMELILDELGVHGDLRLIAYRLAGRVEQDDRDVSSDAAA